MRLSETKRNTYFFIGFWLLGGLCNLFGGTDYLFLNTLMFCFSYMIYAGLLLFWALSVRARLLPMPARDSLIWASMLMLTYMMTRAFKYRFIANAAAPARYAVYAYFLPMTLVPALFLMTSARVLRGTSERKAWDERLLLIPALLLSAMALTNDWHSLVYVPHVPLADFIIANGTYHHGPGFYAIYAWMFGAGAAAVALLLRASRRRPGRCVLQIVGVLALWSALILTNVLVFFRFGLRHPYNDPDIHIFGMLAVIEVCIRGRLIPNNESYPAYFARLGLPVLITDRDLRCVYRTDVPLTADRDQLRSALAAPVALDEDTRLSGMPIPAGYAFWAEDERELHRENARLAAANELLGQENDLIRVENELSEKKARLDAQVRVYDRIAQALYARQKRVEALLRDADPEDPAFRRALGECCVLNAWSKRKSNLLLLSEDTLPRRNRELFLALQESARYLKYCGVEAAAMGEEYSALPLKQVHALYDTFEAVVETYLPYLRRMTVSLMAGGLRLAMETTSDPPLPATRLSVERRRSDEYTFLILRADEETEAGPS